MDNFNFVSSIEDQSHIHLYDHAGKQSDELIDSLLSEIILSSSELHAQALIRGYLVCRKFKIPSLKLKSAILILAEDLECSSVIMCSNPSLQLPGDSLHNS